MTTLIVAAFESRDEKTSILRQETFDNRPSTSPPWSRLPLAILIGKGLFLPSLQP